MGYIHFERIFGERFSRYQRDLEPERAERLLASGFTVVGVDSSQPDLDEGHVGRERYDWIRKQFDRPDHVKILVIHHHLVPIPGTGRERNIITDAGDLLALLNQLDIDIVLSGHKHVPFFWGLNGILICNSSTAATRRVRGLTPSSWNELHVDASTVKVYTHYADGRRELSVIFSRKTRAMTREAFYLTDAFLESNHLALWPEGKPGAEGTMSPATESRPAPRPHESREPSVGVAVSGGGHRAALFALGTLMYLADSGRNHDVTSIASVSGGSMTNGVVAQSMDFRTVDGPTFQRLMTPYANRLATKGTFQGRPITSPDKLAFLVPLLLLGLFALFPVSRPARYAIYMVAVAVWAALLVPPLFGTTLARVYAFFLLLSLVAALVTWWAVPIPAGRLGGVLGEAIDWLASSVGRFVLFLLSILAWGWLAALRGKVCAAAFRKTLFAPDGRATLLRDIHAKGIDHVFCTTDLQSAEPLYFGKDFIYGYRFGKGEPASLPLHEAVQASANLPFAFPDKWIATRGHDFRYLDPKGACPEPDDRPKPYPPHHMVLTDGGVYDNMADQWAQGFEERASRCWPDLREAHPEPNVLIVANASAGLEWQTMRRSRIPLFGEVAALVKITSVLYDQTTAQRRAGLVGRFGRAELERRGLRGAILNIPQSPYAVADEYARFHDGLWSDRAKRANGLIALLGDDDHHRDRWKKGAKEDAEIATTLSAVGVERSAQLLCHAYLLAMANCHVILGYPLPRSIPPSERFDRMVRGVIEETPSWTFEPAGEAVIVSAPSGPPSPSEPTPP